MDLQECKRFQNTLGVASLHKSETVESLGEANMMAHRLPDPKAMASICMWDITKEHLETS